MADSGQLALLLHDGVDAWNAWRKEYKGVVPDLSGAHLTKADLAGGGGVGANLYRANLRDANLFGANLQGVNLREADLSHAELGFTIFGDTNLSGTIGLEYCRHTGPSVVDHQTMMKSWPLPVAFLRGCGLPEALIEYFPSLVNEPIQFYSCFISYSTRDDEFVHRLYADLQVKGVRCWFAPEDIKIGDRFRQRIDDAIRLHDKLLIVLSENSVQSAWVREEVESCLEREQRENRTVLFPIRLDDAVMNTNEAWAASIRRQRHIGDFQEWKEHDAYQKGFKRLLRDLKPENKNGNDTR
ncbi:MAG: toll/interleukin-1 receptor domain-containing protein [Acidobacteriia bacterium]|nr:toll/interleukin-1 receptor domain-containing protein [Terriglobia bacterium]